jgi:signal transduction histidine kinase
MLGEVNDRLGVMSHHIAAAQSALELGATSDWVAAMDKVHDAAGAAMKALRAVLDTLRDGAQRELHDKLGHSVTLICVQAGAAVALAARDTDSAAQSVKRVIEHADIARDQLAQLREALSSPGVSRSSPTRTKPLS